MIGIEKQIVGTEKRPKGWRDNNRGNVYRVGEIRESVVAEWGSD